MEAGERIQPLVLVWEPGSGVGTTSPPCWIQRSISKIDPSAERTSLAQRRSNMAFKRSFKPSTYSLGESRPQCHHNISPHRCLPHLWLILLANRHGPRVSSRAISGTGRFSAGSITESYRVAAESLTSGKGRVIRITLIVYN
jgi:hypothetical protein